jgi:hypothetical protein
MMNGLGRRLLRYRAVLATCLVVIAIGVAAVTSHARAATLVVDDDGRGTAADCNSAALAFWNLQAAINAAQPGDTIVICPGLYAGGPADSRCQTTYPPCAEGQNATVNKSLTIVGARSEETTYVDQCRTFMPSPVTDTVIQPLDPSLPILSIAADNVVVRGIVFEQAATAVSTSASFSGIGYTVDRNLIRDNNVGVDFRTSDEIPSWRAYQLMYGNCIRDNTVDIDVAAPTKVGAEARANTHTTGSQQYPAIAMLKSGYAVAWVSDGQDGAGYGIYGQRFESNGTKAGREFKVNTATAGAQTLPKIATLSNGTFVVVWQSANQDGDGTGIYAQRFSAAGAKSGIEFRANTTTTSNQSQPSIAALADGGFVVAWTSDGQDGGGLGIYGQRFKANGAKASNEFKVNTTTAGDQSRPSVSGLIGGGFVVAWQGPDPSGLGVYMRRYNASGVAQGGNVRVNTVTLNDQSLPAIAALDNGGFVIAWQSNRQDGSGLGIYLQRYNSAGVKVGGAPLVNTETANNQATPVAAGFSPVFTDGGFVIVWCSKNQDGSGWGVYAQAYEATGAKASVEFRVNTTVPKDQWQPAVAAGADRTFIAVWSSLDQDGSLEGIFTQRFLVPGSP